MIGGSEGAESGPVTILVGISSEPINDGRSFELISVGISIVGSTTDGANVVGMAVGNRLGGTVCGKGSRMEGDVLGISVSVETGALAGAILGVAAGDGTAIGARVGAEIGARVGAAIGARDGAAIGARVGAEIGARVGAAIGARDGAAIGARDGAAIGVAIGAVGAAGAMGCDDVNGAMAGEPGILKSIGDAITGDA
jgi:hypothetical protein